MRACVLEAIAGRQDKCVEIIAAVRSRRHKKQSAPGGGENKNPEPLHARARYFKASVKAGASHAEPVAADTAAVTVNC
ncbi:MAG: hypothetical protein DME59_14930 [Verrucomicrobia bacterium]|nr:MAG: hypothetical protein DME59_14930 [Verrucomicrobiota bacterium]PYL78167.1 MAG: hypothetical protein DMF26_01500 [Verrucomicrobiota bacterium]